MNNIVNFYDTLDLKYAEICIVLEDVYTLSNRVKVSIPILTPKMDNNNMVENSIYQNKRNLKNANKDQINIENIKVSNYVEIPFPSSICDGPDSDGIYIRKGSKWIIVFIGGDITMPRPIARFID